MKPVKKTNQGAKKKDLNDNKKISNYFQIQSSPIIEDNRFENTKPIYVELLKKTLESKDFFLFWNPFTESERQLIYSYATKIRLHTGPVFFRILFKLQNYSH